MVPPPKGIEWESGILLFVLIPPMEAIFYDYFGYPFNSTFTSVDVPPISTTIPSSSLVKKEAPLKEFVGPLLNVKEGYLLRIEISNTVPSFWENKSNLFFRPK